MFGWTCWACVAALVACGETDGDEGAATCEPLTASEAGTEIFLEDFVDGQAGTWRLVEVEMASAIRGNTAPTLVGRATLSTRANLDNPDVHGQPVCSDPDDLEADEQLTQTVSAGIDVDRKTGQQSSELTIRWQQIGGEAPQFTSSTLPTSDIVTAKPSTADTSRISRLPDGRVEIFFTAGARSGEIAIATRLVYALAE